METSDNREVDYMDLYNYSSNSHTGYYDDANDFTMVNARLHFIAIISSFVSIALLSIAFVVWCLFAIKKRPASPYRLVSFIMMIISSIVALVIGVFFHLNDAQTITAIVFDVSDLIMVFSILGYNILCVIRALKKTVTTGQILVCVLNYILIAVVCTAISRGLVFAAAETYDQINIQNVYIFNIQVPKLVSLIISLVVNTVLTYWLFVPSNVQYEHSREYKVMRYSNVVIYFVIAVMAMKESVLTAAIVQPCRYCFAIVTMLFANQGILISVLLCFLDLEILECLPCGCIDFSDDYNKMDDETADRKLIANDIESTLSTTKEGQLHVTSFEMDITPRDPMQTKQIYGSIPKRP